jgi:arginine:agmatine antiporter
METAPDKGGTIGPLTGMLLVATTMVGSGIFLLPATLAGIGSISVISWIVAAAGALIIGIAMSGLSSLSDGSVFEAIGVTLGSSIGKTAALLYFIAYPLVLAAIALAAAGNIAFLVPMLATPGMITLTACVSIVLLAILTQRGPRLIGRFGSLTLVIGGIPILLMATIGWWFFNPAIFSSGWNVSGRSDHYAVFDATLLCFFSFLGLEVASVIKRHMRNPRRNVPIATAGGILLSAVLYVSATAAISGIVPTGQLKASTAPFADASNVFLGSVAAVLVAVAAAAKALGTLGSCHLAATETWLSFQRQLKIQGLSFGATNAALAVIALLLAWGTASPDLAAQFGRLVGAVAVIILMVFAIGGLALARAASGLSRLNGLLAMAFALGVIGVQPVPAIFSIGLMTVILTSFFVALRRYRT